MRVAVVVAIAVSQRLGDPRVEVMAPDIDESTVLEAVIKCSTVRRPVEVTRRIDAIVDDGNYTAINIDDFDAVTRAKGIEYVVGQVSVVR